MNGITKLRYGLTIVLAMLAASFLYSIFLGAISVGETAALEKEAAGIFYKLSASERAAVTKYYTALPDSPDQYIPSVILGLTMIAALILLLVITLLVWSVKEIRGE